MFKYRDKLSLINIESNENSYGLYKGFILFISFYIFIRYIMDILYKLKIYDLIGYNNTLLLASVLQLVLIVALVKLLKINIFNRSISAKHLSITILISLIIIVIGVFVSGYLLILYNNTKDSLGKVTTTNQNNITQYRELSSIYVSFFRTVIVAPITEEIVFRGSAISLKSKWDKLRDTKLFYFVMILIYSLLFGSMHMPSNMIELLYYSSLGFSLGIVALYTNSITLPLIFHVMINMINVITTLN